MENLSRPTRWAAEVAAELEDPQQRQKNSQLAVRQPFAQLGGASAAPGTPSTTGANQCARPLQRARQLGAVELDQKALVWSLDVDYWF